MLSGSNCLPPLLSFAPQALTSALTPHKPASLQALRLLPLWTELCLLGKGQALQLDIPVAAPAQKEAPSSLSLQLYVRLCNVVGINFPHAGLETGELLSSFANEGVRNTF